MTCSTLVKFSLYFVVVVHLLAHEQITSIMFFIFSPSVRMSHK